MKIIKLEILRRRAGGFGIIFALLIVKYLILFCFLDRKREFPSSNLGGRASSPYLIDTIIMFVVSDVLVGFNSVTECSRDFMFMVNVVCA